MSKFEFRLRSAYWTCTLRSLCNSSPYNNISRRIGKVDTFLRIIKLGRCALLLDGSRVAPRYILWRCLIRAFIDSLHGGVCLFQGRRDRILGIQYHFGPLIVADWVLERVVALFCDFKEAAENKERVIVQKKQWVTWAWLWVIALSIDFSPTCRLTRKFVCPEIVLCLMVLILPTE